METPDEVIDMAALYLKIYFVGVPFFMLYNYGAAVLRAVGETRRPLDFLVISGAVNANLNKVLVILLNKKKVIAKSKNGLIIVIVIYIIQ